MQGIPKRVTASVEMVDGTTYTMRVLPIDVMRMERHYRVSMAKLAVQDPQTGAFVGDGLLVEHAMYMAWSALVRTGEWSGDFDSFMEQVANVEDEEPEPPNPLTPAP